MLPRMATTTDTVQPSLAVPAGASVEAAARPQLSAAALANLRAEVLLRLIETMLKHMPRTGEAPLKATVTFLPRGGAVASAGYATAPHS